MATQTKEQNPLPVEVCTDAGESQLSLRLGAAGASSNQVLMVDSRDFTGGELSLSHTVISSVLPRMMIPRSTPAGPIVLSTIPTISTTIFGLLIGELLRNIFIKA